MDQSSSPTRGQDSGEALSRQIQVMEDRFAIDQLISRFGQIMDMRDIAALPTAVTPENVEMISGGLEYMKSTWAATQHIISDRLIEIDGDRATVKANLIGTSIAAQLADRAADDFNAAGRDQFEVRGRYVYDLIRTTEGWRIANTELAYLWTQGAPPAA